jgi:hypothetical protein
MNKIDPQPVRHGNLYVSLAAILFAISGTLANEGTLGTGQANYK